MLIALALLTLASPSYAALFFLRGKRWRRLLASIVRIDFILLRLLATDDDTKRFLTDFPAMIADDTIDYYS